MEKNIEEGTEAIGSCCCFEDSDSLKIGHKAPGFKAKAYAEHDIKDVKLSDYKGKWVVLFFYPGDFTFVCPTELGELADNQAKFDELGVQILGISTDSEYVHSAWHDSSPTIQKVKYPLLADPTGNISRAYGTYIDEEGVSLRGTFIIDPEGKLVAYELHDNSIGRSAKELIRKIQAAQFVKNNAGHVCPASWVPGDDSMRPGLDMVGKI